MKEITEAEVAMMSDRELIVEYLRRYGEDNPEFKAKLNDGQHTIDGCIGYIRRCAKESITFDGQMSMVWHTRVFGWAKAYYLKPVEKKPAQPAKETEKKKKPVRKPEKPAKEEIAKAVEEFTSETEKASEKAQEKPQKDTPVIKMQPRKPAKKVTKQVDDIYQLDLSLFD